MKCKSATTSHAKDPLENSVNENTIAFGYKWACSVRVTNYLELVLQNAQMQVSCTDFTRAGEREREREREREKEIDSISR